MRWISLLGLVALVGCEDSSFGVGAAISGDSSSPVFAAGTSNVRVAVSP